MEKISVIMSIYKEKKDELKESIESILNQTYSNFEFIIIIDNPEKWRIDFIKKYDDARIKLIINEKNIGLPESLNKGLTLATGEYIARMDADDISVNNRFEKQLKYLIENNYDLVGSNVQCFWNGENQNKWIYPKKTEKIYRALKITTPMAHPTWFGKKKVFDKLNGYRNIFSCEDYDFLIRAANEKFKLSNCQEILLKYRLSPNSISRKNSGRQELVSDFLRKKYLKHEFVELYQIENFIKSKKYSKNIKSIEKYNEIKIKRARYVSKKFPLFYIYSLILIFNLKFSIRNILKKCLYKYIIFKDGK